MPPFDSNTAHVHFEFAFEFDLHKSEEQCEGERMEVDLVVALKS
jgi:hypothetical protein